jgi:hypothetical protein
MQSFPTGNSNVICIRAESVARPTLAAGALVSDEVRLAPVAFVSELEHARIGMTKAAISAILAVTARSLLTSGCPRAPSQVAAMYMLVCHKYANRAPR